MEILQAKKYGVLYNTGGPLWKHGWSDLKAIISPKVFDADYTVHRYIDNMGVHKSDFSLNPDDERLMVKLFTGAKNIAIARLQILKIINPEHGEAYVRVTDDVNMLLQAEAEKRR